jgi:hypothetical protein
MKKLMLDVETLAVDSFATGDAGGGRGTVRGHDTRITEFCNTKQTCQYTVCGTVCFEEAAPQPGKPDEPIE